MVLSCLDSEGSQESITALQGVLFKRVWGLENMKVKVVVFPSIFMAIHMATKEPSIS